MILSQDTSADTSADVLGNINNSKYTARGHKILRVFIREQQFKDFYINFL